MKILTNKINKISSIVLLFTLIVSFVGCNNSSSNNLNNIIQKKNNLPSDWIIMPYEEAQSLYHSIDFTIENINEYLTITSREEKTYNAWNEPISTYFSTEISLNLTNYIIFHDTSSILMDISYTTKSYNVKLNPETLEEIEIIGEPTYSENKSTIQFLDVTSLVSVGYYIQYNTDGSVILNNNDELIVNKNIIVNYDVERVQGHGDWIGNIPNKYYMNANQYTNHANSVYSENSIFLVIEGEKLYYCYEGYDGTNCHYGTTGLTKNGNMNFKSGRAENFMTRKN